jgi:Fur family ferric uptake transcriptional regulator
MPAMPALAAVHDNAIRLIQERGASATAARVQVLRLLLATHATVSHQGLTQAALDEGQPLDKVTLYRVLDWLVAQGLAHSVTGQDRVRRFGIADVHHGHAHFECDACGRLFCLPERSSLPMPAAPDGFEARRVDITVHGRCAECAQTAHSNGFT